MMHRYTLYRSDDRVGPFRASTQGLGALLFICTVLVACGDGEILSSGPAPEVGETGQETSATSSGTSTGTSHSNNATNGTSQTSTSQPCESTEAFFERAVWQPFMGRSCMACHGPGGQGSLNSALDLVAIETDDDLQTNLDVLTQVAARQIDGQSILLLKPAGLVEHGGGAVLDVSSAEYEALVDLVGQLQDPIVCDDPQTGGTSTGGTSTGGTNTGTTGPPTCTPTDTFFQEEVWEPLASPVCMSCHGPGRVGSQASRLDLVPNTQPSDVLANLAAFREVGLETVDGEPYLLAKISGRLTHTGGTLAPPGSATYETLEALIERLKQPVACDEGPLAVPGESVEIVLDPNLLPQDDLFTCSAEAPPASSPARIRRMGYMEWIRNVGFWPSNYQRGNNAYSNNPLTANPANFYSTFDANTSIDVPTLDLYLGSALEAGNAWEEIFGGARLERLRNDGSLRCMYNDEAPDAECARNWATVYLHRAVYFRPPTEDELSPFVTLLQEQLALESVEGITRQETLEHVTATAWLTVSALFRNELGEGEEDEWGRRRLGAQELGHALTFAISHRHPGAPQLYRSAVYSAPEAGYYADIAEAVEDGSILDLDVFATLFEVHASGVDPERVDLHSEWDPVIRNNRGEYWLGEKIRDFFREWLDYGDISQAFKDRPEATSQFDTGSTSMFRSILVSYNTTLAGARSNYYEPLLIHQLDDMIARIVVEDTDVLSNLLTSNRMYVPSNTRNIGTSIEAKTIDAHRMYNITGNVEENREDRWRDLPTSERSGVLTHPAWLAVHGGAFDNDPSVIYRGKWIREQLLCQDVPSLSLVNVDAALDPATTDQNARQRIVSKIESNPECMHCHKLMNPLGMPFEIYNHAGFVRVDDHGSPPDGSSVVTDMPDPTLNGPVNSAIDFTQRLAVSGHVKRCFIRQTFRYFAGRYESRRDACTLAEMERAYDESGGSFLTMLKTLLTSDTFQYRHDPQ